jgi:hypothetical protein
MGVGGLMLFDRAAGSTNVARAAFFSRIVNMTTERGRGRIFGPVDGMVSVLDIILKEGDMLNECTYPEQFT